MISVLYPQEKRSMIMGTWNISIPLGSAFGKVEKIKLEIEG